MTVLGQLLIKSGLVTSRQVEAALRRQEQLGGRLGTCLLELGAITERQLDAALAKQLGLPAARVRDLHNVPEEIHSLLPANLAISCEAVPFRVRDDQVDVAILEIKNRGLHDELAFVIGKWIHVHIANEVRIFEALQLYYGKDCTLRYRTLIERLDQERGAHAADESSDLIEIPFPEFEAEAEPSLTGPKLVYPPSPMKRKSIELTREERQALKEPAAPAEAGAPQVGGGEASPPPPAAPVPDTEALPTPEPARSEPAKVEQHPSAPWPADSAEQIGQLLLSKLEKHFSRAALFRVQRDRVLGWIGFGEGLDADSLSRYQASLGRESVLSNLVQGGNLFVGRLARTRPHAELLGTLGAHPDTECLLSVITVSGRVVSVVLGDRGPKGLDTLDFAAVQQLTARAGDAMQDLLIRKKRKRA